MNTRQKRIVRRAAWAAKQPYLSLAEILGVAATVVVFYFLIVALGILA